VLRSLALRAPMNLSADATSTGHSIASSISSTGWTHDVEPTRGEQVTIAPAGYRRVCLPARLIYGGKFYYLRQRMPVPSISVISAEIFSFSR
jgi:hypothetical protein